jgi:hypothetical protein
VANARGMLGSHSLLLHPWTTAPTLPPWCRPERLEFAKLRVTPHGSQGAPVEIHVQSSKAFLPNMVYTQWSGRQVRTTNVYSVLIVIAL